MPPRQLLFRIRDILDALEAIRSYIAGMEFEGFVADRLTFYSFILNLTFIFYATSHFPLRIIRYFRI